MPDTTHEPDRRDRMDRLMTVASGWASLVLGVLGLHRWLATGQTAWGFLPGDWWAKAGLTMSVGLGVMWIWGYWSEITTRVRAWAKRGGLNSAGVAIIVVLILIGANTLIRRRAAIKYDFTKNKRFTLAPRTKEILRGLKSPIKATVFLPEAARRTTEQVRNLFKQYGDASDKFQWTRKDPLVDPTALIGFNPPPKLNSTDLTGAILEYNGKRQDVADFSEKEVTSAILKMTRDTQRKVLFLTGHGESSVAPGPESGPTQSIQAVVDDLKSLQWTVEDVNLYGKEAKTPDPNDAAVLVIAGPEREFAADEEKRVNEYLEKGGRVLLALSTRGPAFSKFLAKWGIKTGNDLVLDRTQRGLVIVQPDASAHQSVKAARRVLFQPLRSVAQVSTAPTGITVTELLKSGEFSEVIPNFDPKKTVLNEAALATAKPGPIGLAAMAEKSIGTGDTAKKARLVVVGDSGFMSDQLTRLPQMYNLDLANGLINYLGEEEALVSIPPKDENTEQAFLTPDQGRLLPLVHLGDFPLLALILAIVVYLKRR